MIRKLALSALAAGLLATPAFAAETMTVETSLGCSFDIALRPDLAPKHVAQVTKLAQSGFYDGVYFHRVIAGFMAQTGDGQNAKDGGNLMMAGTGSSSEPDIPAEFTAEHFSRGTVGMARSQDPNSGNSQFFIMFDEGGFLDGQYTMFGKVDDQGMACVDKIPPGQGDNGMVLDSFVKMTKVKVK
jgi:peptidylprolyl isomerase